MSIDGGIDREHPIQTMQTKKPMQTQLGIVITASLRC